MKDFQGVNIGQYKREEAEAIVSAIKLLPAVRFNTRVKKTLSFTVESSSIWSATEKIGGDYVPDADSYIQRALRATMQVDEWGFYYIYLDVVKTSRDNVYTFDVFVEYENDKDHRLKMVLRGLNKSGAWEAMEQDNPVESDLLSEVWIGSMRRAEYNISKGK